MVLFVEVRSSSYLVQYQFSFYYSIPYHISKVIYDLMKLVGVGRPSVHLSVRLLTSLFSAPPLKLSNILVIKNYLHHL